MYVFSFAVTVSFALFADVDECASNPCINNGVCENLIDMFLCNCTNDYIGYRCNLGMFEARTCVSTHTNY